MDTQLLATFGSVWGLCAIMAGIAASDKGRRFWVWFAFGLLTGPYAVYRAVRAKEIVPPELAQTCPNCQKTMRKTAKECPHCGHLVLREPDTVMQAGRQAAAAFFILRKAAQKSTAVVKAEQAKREERKRARSAPQTPDSRPS